MDKKDSFDSSDDKFDDKIGRSYYDDDDDSFDEYDDFKTEDDDFDYINLDYEGFDSEDDPEIDEAEKLLRETRVMKSTSHKDSRDETEAKKKSSGASSRSKSSDPYRHEDRRKPDEEFIRKKGAAYHEPEKPKKKAGNTQFLAFMILTVTVGVVVCILAMALVFRMVVGNKQVNPIVSTKPSVTEGLTEKTSDSTTEAIEDGKEISFVGVIQNVDSTSESIEFYNFEEGKSYNLNKDGKSEFKDKYGQDLFFAELKKGDVAVVNYFSNSNILKNLKISPDAWDKKQIKGLKVNAANKTVEVGNEILTYDTRLISLYKDKPFDIANIGEKDIVNIKGFKQQLLYVVLDKGHGGISIINKDGIKDGVLEISDAIYSELSKAEGSYDLTEGTHKVIVKGSNIETYIEEVNVSEGSTAIVDLSKVSFKRGALTIKANIADFTLIIDGKNYNTGEPIMLDYGNYTVKIEKEGYLSQEKTIKIDKDQVNLDFTLEKEIKTARITIITEPDNADIYIDGNLVGKSPQVLDMVYDMHSILVKKDGYVDVDSPLNIVEGGKTTYQIILLAKTKPAEPTLIVPEEE